MKFSVVFLSLIFMVPVAFSKDCDSSLLVEEINLTAGDKYEQDRVLLTAEEGQSVVCEKNSNYSNVFKTADKRLRAQRKNLDRFRRQGLLIAGEYEYYSDFFDLLSSNLKSCKSHINSIQDQDFDDFQTRIVFSAKPSGVSQINIFNTNGKVIRSYRSHLQWFGKIIYDEGFHLCEAKVIKL